MILQIIYVSGETIAFTINGELYYLKTGPDLPRLYTGDLRRLHMPNMDHWLQAQTQQRYSYRGLKDMAAAFADGLSHSYARSDMPTLCRRIYDITRDTIFKTAFVRDYAKTYWIELLDPKQIPKLIVEIKNNFDEMRAKWGDDRLYAYLCRLWQFCSYFATNETVVFERFLERMGRNIGDVHYPMAVFEDQAYGHVWEKISNSDMSRYKGVSDKIAETVDAIQSDRL